VKRVRFAAAGRVRTGEFRDGWLVDEAGRRHRPEEVVWLPPVQPSKVVGLALNYADHAEELGVRVPEQPALFFKPPSSLVGHLAPVVYPSGVRHLHQEVELAVVIGRGGRSIPEAEAMAHVFGYMAANDITARDLQRRHGGQWLKGKAMDRSCPLGPCLVTADEVPDPHALVLRCWVNGQLRQEASTAQMVFTLPRLIAELSWGMTLLPGDILLTGTPEGVGFARNPPLFLQAGDEVVVSIDGIGELRNRLTPFPLSRYERL